MDDEGSPRGLGSDPEPTHNKSSVGISSQPAIAEHYNRIEDKGLEARSKSKIYYLRNFNNWVKSILISRCLSPGDSVLDLACGKGGDFLKWQKGRVRHVVAADHARVSVQDAFARFNKIHPPPFYCIFVAADCWEQRLSEHLPRGLSFDLTSCQFALHYSFQSEAKARMMMMNAAERLRPGGYFVGTIPDANVIVKRMRSLAAEEKKFGNSCFELEFPEKWPLPPKFGAEYIFTLSDAVEKCPEYLVHFPTLQEIAASHDLELVYKARFHDFYTEHSHKPEHLELLSRMDCLNADGTIPADQWEALGIYMVFIFKKKSTSRLALSTVYTAPPPSKATSLNFIDLLLKRDGK